MNEELDEELQRLSEPVPERTSVDSKAFRQPLEKLFSKKAICIDGSETVRAAVALMRDKEFGAICVTQAGQLVGILTERDIIMVLGAQKDLLGTQVSKVMTPNPIALMKDDPIIHVMHNMQVGGYRHVPVVDEDGKPLSIVSIKDVVRYILNFFQRDVYNVTPEPFRGPVSREGA